MVFNIILYNLWPVLSIKKSCSNKDWGQFEPTRTILHSNSGWPTLLLSHQATVPFRSPLLGLGSVLAQVYSRTPTDFNGAASGCKLLLLTTIRYKQNVPLCKTKKTYKNTWKWQPLFITSKLPKYFGQDNCFPIRTETTEETVAETKCCPSTPSTNFNLTH